jgi:hypothetical protein
MDVLNDLGPGFLSAYISIEVTCLPEVLPLSFQLASGRLLDNFQKLTKQDAWRFVDQKMHVLRHQDIGIEARLMPRSRLFQDLLDLCLSRWAAEIWQPVEAAKGDEVQRLGSLIPAEAVGHGSIIPESPRHPEDPLIAVQPR